jgi:RNA polymerase sigma-70 factor (ECF subfamily)
MRSWIDTLCGRLLAPAPEQLASIDRAAAADALEGLRNARRALPRLVIDEQAFFAFVAQRLEPRQTFEELLAQLAKLEMGDLTLAFGCLCGDDEAGRVFSESLRPTLERVLAGLGRPPSELGELQGTLFAHLFGGRDDGAAKIEHYRGEGSLRSWVKVVAVRMLLNRLRDDGRMVGEEQLLEQALDTDPADVRYMKALYRDEFKRAFQQALGSLDVRQRTLLRFQLLDGMSATEIARFYRVHRATVHRWQQQIQVSLLERTRAHLRDQLAVEPAEVDSIVRLIQSNWQVSLTAALRADSIRLPPAHSDS